MFPQASATTGAVACALSHVRDEEAAGSHPATPTMKLQVAALLCDEFPLAGLGAFQFGSELEPTLSGPPR